MSVDGKMQFASNRNTAMTTKRLDYIDLAKGLGMLTIIWGHIHTGMSTQLVYSFHIPLFFFLSGLVFFGKRYDSFLVFLKKRWKGLIFPYFIFSLLTWMVWAAYSCITHAEVENYWMPLLQTFIAQGSEGYLIHNVPLWFVMCLFVVEVIYYFTSKLSTMANIVVCIVLGSIGAWMSVTDVWDFSVLPWSIDVALMALPFYAFGGLVNVQIGHEKLMSTVAKHRWTTALTIVVATVVMYMGGTTNSQVSMGHAYLGKSLWVFYPTALCGITAFVSLCLLLTSYKSLTNSKLIVAGILFGKSSFRAMAIHNPIKGIIIVLLSKATHSSTSTIQAGTLTSIVAFVVTFILTWLVIKAIELILQKTLKRNSILP